MISREHVSSGTPVPVSICEAGECFRNGRLTSRQLTEHYLAAIEKSQPQLNAFISVLGPSSIEAADARDQELVAGTDRGPLHGIPVVVKDLCAMAGTVTTCGSKVFRNRVTPEDATIVRQLKKAGAIILGKTNMNEFAAGVSGKNADFGDAHNPWDLSLSPGGSSSGTGAAVAAGLCLGGMGTDTGGSIRVPASWCGITGIRPTAGLVSRTGIFPRSRTLDAVGPLARNVRDLAYLLDAMIGFDPTDQHSALAQPRLSYTHDLEGGIKGVTFATVRNYTFRDVDPVVADAVHAATDALRRGGASVIEIELPSLEGELDYNALFSNVLLYEFNIIFGHTYRNALDSMESYGPIVQDDLRVGARVPQAEYERMIRERPAVIAQMKAVFQQVDALLTPALPMLPPRLDASGLDYDRGRMFTLPFSHTELPSVVLPCGLSPDGLPIGLQIVGDHFQEAFLLRVAAAVENGTTFTGHSPLVCFF